MSIGPCKIHNFLTVSSQQFFFPPQENILAFDKSGNSQSLSTSKFALYPAANIPPNLDFFFFFPLQFSVVEIIWFAWFSSENWTIKIHAYSPYLILANSFHHSS